MTLIEELYSSKAVGLIRDLYHEDEDARVSFYQTFGNKIIQSQEKILLSDPLNILMFICSTAPFATSNDESQQVAIMIHKRIREKNPLPYVLDDRGLDLAEKTLISLSFFKPALMARWKKGAPHPGFYRTYSKRTFESEGFGEIAQHHEQWENFFSEFFI
jgi:hypothetical protein